MATMPCSGSSTSPMPVMMSECSRSATASIASSRRRMRSVRQSLASSTAERIRLPWCLSSLPSKRSNSVKASAVPPAKPARMRSWYRRLTFFAPPLTTTLPRVTWPSPPSATLEPRRTERMVVPWKDSMGRRFIWGTKAGLSRLLAKSAPYNEAMEQHAHHHHHHSAAQAAPAKPGAKYTCPMHPQIVRDAPGSCPICGMALVPIAGTGEADDSELRDLTRRLWIGIALSIPLVALAMAPMIGIADPFGVAPRPRGWIEFALGTPVVLWVGWPILTKFWLSLRHWSLNMYSLIGLGVGLAYLYSLAAVFFPGLFPPEFREHDGAVG